MTLCKDVSQAGTEEVDPVQDLAEFEPDPAGDGSIEPGPISACDTADDPQWIVWADADEEAVWAEVELVQIGAGWRL